MVAIFTGAGTGFERGSGSTLGASGLLGSASFGRSGQQLFLNAFNGNLVASRQDEFLVGRGPDISVARTYNSLGNFVDDNGDNWLQSTDRRVFGLTGAANSAGSTVKRRAGDGSEMLYSWNGTAYFATDGAGSYDRLSYDGTSWTWVDGDSRETETYSAYGAEWRIATQFTSTSTLTGLVTYSYSGANLSRVSKADGEYVEYKWAGNNIVQIVTGFTAGSQDAIFADQLYDLYDAAFNRAPDPGGFYTYLQAMREGVTIAQIAQYAYGSSEYAARGVGAMSNTQYVDFLFQSVLRRPDDGTGRAFYGTALDNGTWTRGQLLQIFAESSEHQTVLSSLPDRRFSGTIELTRTRYAYDGYNRLSSVTVDLSPGDNNIADGNVYITAYTYDGTSKRIATISETDGSYVSIGYDGANRVASLTQAVASGVTRTTILSYGAGYTVVTDPAGQATTLHYDSAGQLRQVTAPPAYPGAAQQVVQFGYNGNGDLTGVTDAAGQAASYTYDANGNVLTSTDRLGNTITRTFNSLNRLLNETRTGSDKDSAAASHTTRNVYDDKGLLRFTVSPEGRVVEHRYSIFGIETYRVLYTGKTYDVGGLAPATALSLTQLTQWMSSLEDPTAAQITTFTYDARGNLTRETVYGAAQTPTSGSTTAGYTETIYVYDQAGQLLSRQTTGRNAEYLVYDGLERVTASTDVNGGTTRFVFDDAATQTVVTLASGLVRTQTYNKAGELVSSVDSGGYVLGGTTTYRYDANGRVRMTTSAAGIKNYYLYDKVGRKIADVNENGFITEYRYDANDRLVATVHYTDIVNSYASTIALLADPGSVIDLASIRPAPHGSDIWNWTVYDKEGHVLETIEGDGSVTAYEYDASGRLVRTRGSFNKLSSAQTAAFMAAAPASVALPASHANDTMSQIFYDKDGRTIGVLNAEGYLTRTIYDAAGQKVQEIAYANATPVSWRGGATLQELIDNVTWAPNANDRSARYVYDGQGFLRFTIDALNHVTQYFYGDATLAFGLVRQTTQYAGTIGALASYTYDSVKNAVAAMASDPANRTSYSVYDAAGRLAYSIDAAGGVTGYRYDSSGRLTRKAEYATLRSTGSLPTIGDMDGWAASYSTGSDRIARYYYTARDELKVMVDAEGYVTGYDYDADGRKTWEARWDVQFPVTDAWSIVDVVLTIIAQPAYTNKSYAYDPAGNITLAYDGDGSYHRYYYYGNGALAWDIAMEGTADEARTFYTYDHAGRLIARYDAESTDAQAVTLFEYDGLGDLVGTTANGHTTRWSYDKLGRKIGEIDALGGVSGYEYDAFGNMVRTIDARGNSTYSYYDKAGRAYLIRDAENYITETGYTAFGEAAWVKRWFTPASNGAAVGTTPSGHDTGSVALTQFSYDKLGRVLNTTDAEGYTETNWYDAFGEIVQSRNKLGLITNFTYFKRGLLDAEYVNAPVYDNAGNQVAAGYYRNLYYYDSRGNVVKQIEAYGLPEQRDTWFAYDKANRLIAKEGTGVAAYDQSNHVGSTIATLIASYKYDKRGNLIETTDANGARTLLYYDDLDRKVAEMNAVGTLSTYGYDAAGNMTVSRTYANAVALPGVPGGLPPAPPAGDFRETTYAYDALDRLTSASVAGVRTGAWNGSTFVLSTAPVTTSYAYDAMGNRVGTTDGNGGTVYSYYDKLGRQIAQVDQEGYVTRWALDAEGNVLLERRYALQTSGATATAQPAVPDNAYDRVTAFDYDRMGRRVAEYRYNVKAYAVNPANGLLYGNGGTASIHYSYNALGQVTRKTEATGEHTDFEYDSSGRLVRERRAAFVDYRGAAVQPVLSYFYDGLGNLVRSVEAGNGASDHVTTSAYDGRGRLTATGDASGGVTEYYYDAAGNVLRRSYVRTRADGSSAYEGTLYTRDALGRVTTQAAGLWNGSSWVKGDIQATAYNAYGDVAQRGTNGIWQEQFAYDGLGRLYGSNTGDGVWRYYVHDANGNQTAIIESEGSSIGGLPLDGAISIATAGFAYGLGQAYVDGVSVVINAYDRRGQATTTIQAKRELGAGIISDLIASRAYNAFGEVSYEVDARGYVTSYGYNAIGRILYAQRPQVLVTAENGSQAWSNPTDYYYYDISGRLIGTQDANGNRTTLQLLSGTGYGGGEALVLREWHPDSGTISNGYDAFGDVRTTVDQIGRTTNMSYDGMGRLTQVSRPGGLTDYYAYDVLGQRTRHWNNVVGAAGAEITDYDLQGRVVRQVAFGGDVTTTGYAWNAAITTSGMGTFGGWVTTTGYANGLSAIQQDDLHGRTVWKQDLGGHQTSLTYDLAGRMTGQSTAGQATSYAWLSNGLVGTIATTVAGVTTSQSSTYDQAGNKLTEVQTRGGAVIQNATASYDALGRLQTWSEAGNATTPAASLAWSYDANSNIRSLAENYAWLNSDGSVWGPGSATWWYRYDAMDRVVTDRGQLVGGTIVRGVNGVDIAYDALGRRATVLNDTSLKGMVEVYVPDGHGGGTTPPMPDDPGTPNENGHYERQERNYTGLSLETYAYDAAGNLASVALAVTGYVDNGNGTLSATGAIDRAMGGGSYSYDLLGRQLHQVDTVEGGRAVYDHAQAYDAKGRVETDTVTQLQGSDIVTSITSNQYGDGTAAYALGAVTRSTTSGWRYVGGTSYQSSPGTATAIGYAWYDGAVQAQVDYTPNTGAPGAVQHSYYSYTPAGVLASVSIQDGRPRTVTLVNDVYGQALRRDESDNNPALGDPHEAWYRFNGRQLGSSGNNSTYENGYATSLDDRTHTIWGGPGAFRYGGTAGTAKVEFNDRLTPVNTYGQGGAGGSYTVREGDSLSGIATMFWGDASLWYVLAQANGLGGDGALRAGQALTIPSGVQRNTNSAATFKAYDPADAFGDTSPTTPQPQKGAKKGCGTFGQILVAVVSLAVTIALPQVSALFNSLGGQILGGLVANAAGQGVGIATGIQERFDFGALAMAGVAAGVAGGLGKAGVFKQGGSPLSGAARAVAGNAITQGIGVATGLQSRFDFAGVAAAGVGALAGAGTGGKFGRVAGIGADALASAATRAALTGTDFGDNILAVLPDVIAHTLGAVAEEALSPSHDRVKAAMREAKAKVDAAPTARRSGARNPLDNLLPIDGSQVGDEIVVTAQRSNGALFVPYGYTPLSMMSNVLYDSHGTLPTDADVLAWARSRTSLLTRTLNPSNLKWIRRASVIGAVGDILFNAAPGGVEYSIPLFGENATLEYTAPNLFNGYSIISNGDAIGFAPRTDLANVFLIEGVGGVLGTISGNNAVVMRTVDVGGEQIQAGFGVSIQSQREAEIYNEGIANGWSNDRINDAIDAERVTALFGGGGDFRLADMRYAPGTAFNSSPLTDADHSWLTKGSGAVPAQVAAALSGQKFDSFDAFRETFWKTVANTPELASGFTLQNVGRMQAGNAPRTFRGDWLGKQATFQIHHPEQIRYGGAVYDMSNMLIVTPRMHNDLHRPNR